MWGAVGVGLWGTGMSDSAIVQVRSFLEQLSEGSWTNEDARRARAEEMLKLLTEWGRCWPIGEERGPEQLRPEKEYGAPWLHPWPGKLNKGAA